MPDRSRLMPAVSWPSTSAARSIRRAQNTAGLENIHCVQADLLALPLASASFDFVYSLGVLHHLADTERALAGLVDKVRPGGKLRIYLYWKRHGWQGALLSVVTLARRVTVRMPFGLLRLCCFAAERAAVRSS